MDADRPGKCRTSSSRRESRSWTKFHGIIAANADNILQVAGYTAVLTIGVLSLLPGALRPDTGAPGQLEHLIAYFGTSVILASRPSMPDRRWRASLLLVPYAGALELAQLFVPGRHARFSDFLVSSVGALLGAVAAIGVAKIVQRLLSRHSTPRREPV